MIRNLRVRLTLWFMALVMLIYVADSALALFVYDNQLKSETYKDLGRLCLEIAPVVEMQNGKPTLSGWAQTGSKLHLKPEATVQLFDSERKLVELYGLPGVPRLQSGLVVNHPNEDGAVSNYSSYMPVGTTSYVQVQVPTKQHDDAISDFLLSHLLRSVAIALAVGVCGWFYSGKAIEPVLRTLRTLRTFVDDAGHELKTPVALIEGSLETLEADLGDYGLSTDVLQIISRASARLKNLSANLLLLAKMENPELELRRTPLDAKELITGIVNEFSERAGANHVRLTLTELPSMAISGDREALSRVFSNLVENAIRYTPAGGSITVGGWRQDNCLCISVEDTGIGIPSESLPHIFERFYRVDKARSREAGGSGLGLAIVKATIDAHAGAINVESNPGRGSKFVISLPLGNKATAA